MEYKDMAYQVTSELHSTVTLKISGLRCQSCVQRVEAALSSLSGVTDARVNLTEQKAYVSYEAALINTDDLTTALERQGYRALESEAKDKESPPNYCGRTLTWFSIPRPYIFGTIASFAIVGIYLGMNTLPTQEESNAGSKIEHGGLRRGLYCGNDGLLFPLSCHGLAGAEFAVSFCGGSGKTGTVPALFFSGRNTFMHRWNRTHGANHE
jgi:copper chaperone CopZ